MNKRLSQILLDWPKPYITGADLFLALDGTPAGRQAILKRAVHEGDLIRLRRDFYLIKRYPGQPLVDLFELAPLLYGPSYVSLESALQFHGWIPEAVPVTTCITVKKSKELETPLGLFTYHYIPLQAFSMGVNQLHQNKSTLLIADPWKAIADLIYTQKRSWKNLEELCSDMRIEDEVIRVADKNTLMFLSKNYPNERVKKTLKRLIHEH